MALAVILLPTRPPRPTRKKLQVTTLAGGQPGDVRKWVEGLRSLQ